MRVAVWIEKGQMAPPSQNLVSPVLCVFCFTCVEFQKFSGLKSLKQSLLCFCIPPIGQGGGASADWQAAGQSPAVVGRVPGVEKSLSGAVLSGARLHRRIRPRPAPHPLALAHALLHRDPRLTSATHTHTHTYLLSSSGSGGRESIKQQFFWWTWDPWRFGSTSSRRRRPHVTSIYELIGSATPAGSGGGRLTEPSSVLPVSF